MTRKARANPHHGSSVDNWFEEEEKKRPGFLAEVDEEVERMALAHQLKELREAAGLSQAALAKRIGTKPPGIARLESGKFDSASSSPPHLPANFLKFLFFPEFFSNPNTCRRSWLITELRLSFIVAA